MSQQQREQAALLASRRRVALVVLAGVNGSKRGRFAPTITLARAATHYRAKKSQDSTGIVQFNFWQRKSSICWSKEGM